MTRLQLDMIESRTADLVGDVWHDGDEIGDQVREDLAALQTEVTDLVTAYRDLADAVREVIGDHSIACTCPPCVALTKARDVMRKRGVEL